jgi:UDP-N-acetylglucosamine 2-epimerase (non-hydrolysing)
MSAVFFEQLKLPPPDVDLGVGSGTHAEQTAAVMVAFERHVADHPTDAVVVVGDVNSTLAAALVAAKLGIPVAHVEAGLRSRDWSMPEEVNRVLTDRLSQWLLTPSADADDNLAAEGIAAERVHLVGNVMIDTLLANLDEARARSAADVANARLPAEYAVLTLHRPSNVDDPGVLGAVIAAIGEVAGEVPVAFPVHPRTRRQLESIGIPAGLRCLEPMPYLDFIGLVDGARLVMTDSGGIQEETSVLGVPCLTLRDTTERPITCELGTNRVIGTDPAAIPPAARAALATEWRPASIPLWDGHAGERIAEVLLRDL